MRLWRLALPMIFLQWLAVAASVFDSRFLAETNHLQLAAFAISYRYYLLVLIFSAGIQMAMAVRIAAARDINRNKILANAGSFCLLLALPTAAFLYCCPLVLLRIGVQPNLMRILYPYFHILSFASIFLWFSGLWRQALLALGKPKVITYLAIIYFITHVLCSYILIQGHLYFPAMGLQGVAYSELISLATVTVISGIVLARDYKLFSVFSSRWAQFYQQWKQSWPVSLLWLNEMLAMIIIVMLISKVSINALAAYQMVSQLDLLLLMVPYATSMACAVVFAKANNAVQLYSYLKQALYIVLIPMLMASCVFLLFGQQTLHVFFNPKNTSILPLAAQLLMITAVYHLFDSVRKILIGCLRGLGDIMAPLAISVVSFWGVGVVGAIVLHSIFPHNVLSIWLAFASAIVFGSIAIALRFRYITSRQRFQLQSHV